jgi:hypothetical protein
MSAYVALSCLIAFVIVITICLVKQFIWDPLLSKRFEVLRPVLSESVRKLSTSFYRPQSTTTSNLSINKSLSDSYIKPIEPINKNLITIPQNFPSNDNQINPINKILPRRSYGSSSFNFFAYTNYGSEDLSDDKIPSYPILHFSCEYNPSTFSIRLNVQNLRNMNSLLLLLNNLITKNADIFLRFRLSTTITGEPYETSSQNFQDFIRFGETFTILSNIRSGDILNYQIKFILMLIIDDKNIYELGDAIYSMKDDQLTHTLYIERILPINLEKKLKSPINEDND